MKNYLFISLALLSFVACDSDSSKLEKPEAIKLIREAYQLPKPITADLNVHDPDRASLLRDNGPQEIGLVKVLPYGIEVHVDSPMFSLTDAGKQYLVPEETTPDQYVVRVAESDLAEDENFSIAMGADNRTAVVSYTIRYSDVTPFQAVYPSRKFTEPSSHKAYFRKTDSGWELDKKPDAGGY